MKHTHLQVSIIASDADIASGVRALIRVCPAMARAHGDVGFPPLRRWEDGFAGLVRIVVGQQLSTASAGAIHGRLTAGIVPLDAGTFAATSETVLRTAGLSTAKIAALRAIAGTEISGDLDLVGLGTASPQTVREALTAIRGVGPWTADMYLMFCRGDRDAFAPGDLALQIGAARLLDRANRPTAAELEQIAERWRPWRGVAARLIWAHYAAVKVKAVALKPGGR